MIWRLLRGLPLALLSPFLLFFSMLGLWLTDLIAAIFGRKERWVDTRPDTSAASVVIPNWNGKDLMEKYLPSVVTAMSANPRNEVIVVDNGSKDGSVEFLKANFPTVRVVALPKNLGFGEGSNTGFRAAKNDIVVLLNSDMRVAPDFLKPLLDGFHDEHVFAVACQIFFSDPNKKREETGLTQAWWDSGRIGVRHRLDDEVNEPFPCFYPGGGSSAFDRRKFLELGGFDHLLAPFYLEDTDLGYGAWKRGWKLYYQPKSHVWHEHRGTIGRTHSRDYINNIIQKNFLLFLWKNIHEPRKLFIHFFRTWADSAVTWFAGPSPERSSFSAVFRAFRQLPQAMASRWGARRLANVTDTEAFHRTLGGYFHDRFSRHNPNPSPMKVLFVSPYPIYPPVHGGGVFMYGTAKALATRTELHLATILDEPWQEEQHEPLTKLCKTAAFLARPDQKIFTFGALDPHAVLEFASHDFEWLLHRSLYLNRIDVLQIEYTNMAQYAGQWNNIVISHFEHDVYFQSIGRGLQQPGGTLRKASAAFEYLRAIRFELNMLGRVDLIQVCSRENQDYLLSYRPQLKPKMDATLRAGIDTTAYTFHAAPRDPFTMLFLGSFRHLPNAEALDWFVKHVLPHVIAQCPQAKLVIIGSDPPPRHSLPIDDNNVEIRGFVEDIHEPFRRYGVFICPILTGSGVRVKLLEAFASGIPCVSTKLGAEGLSAADGEICRLADDPREFANHIVQLFENPESAAQMVERARSYVTAERDITRMTERLIEAYKTAVRAKRTTSRPRPS